MRRTQLDGITTTTAVAEEAVAASEVVVIVAAATTALKTEGWEEVETKHGNITNDLPLVSQNYITVEWRVETVKRVSVLIEYLQYLEPSLVNCADTWQNPPTTQHG